MKLVCLNCPNERRAGQYLCPPCWFALSAGARRALNLKDEDRLVRVRSLTTQIRGGRRLDQIEIPK